MTLTNSDYHLFFHYCNGIGPKTFKQILQVFDTALNAYNSSSKLWYKAGFGKNTVEKVVDFKNKFNIQLEKEKLVKSNISYLPNCSENFPSLLKEIADCPIGLFIKGTFETVDNKAIAIVGTRKPTIYGREVTQKFASSLVNYGFTIVSGLARGIDSISHRSALDNNGRTIAVLGSGLDNIYPPENKVLAGGICQHGALVSEYPPETLPNPGNFPARNRIISGLSLGVVITEGTEKSGTNITAMSAVEQNREVFAVPGSINSEMSKGPAKLIQLGAKLITSVEDILAELNIYPTTNSGDRKNYIPNFENKNQEEIWKFLSRGANQIDEISRTVKLSMTEVTANLTLMELSGLVKNIGDGNYMIL